MKTSPARRAVALHRSASAKKGRLLPTPTVLEHRYIAEQPHEGIARARSQEMSSRDSSLDVDRFCRDLVDGTPDAVIYADVKGLIRIWNRGAERIFGYTAEEALGSSLDIIIPDRLRVRHRRGYEQTLKTGQTRYSAGDLLAVPAMRKDGSMISVEFTIVPMADGSGRLRGIGAILRDVTERFTELKELRKRAGSQDRL
jgi:PAS domain S-box-containing protein